MKIYGVYEVYGWNAFGEDLAIDCYFLSRAKALAFIANEGGPDADIDDWLIELEVIE